MPCPRTLRHVRSVAAADRTRDTRFYKPPTLTTRPQRFPSHKKPTVLPLRKVSTLVSLRLPSRLTRTDTVCIALIFGFLVDTLRRCNNVCFLAGRLISAVVNLKKMSREKYAEDFYEWKYHYWTKLKTLWQINNMLVLVVFLLSTMLSKVDYSSGVRTCLYLGKS